MGYAYGSPEAVQFADESMEAISYYAIEASSDLAMSAVNTRPIQARCGIRASSQLIAWIFWSVSVAATTSKWIAVRRWTGHRS